MNRTRIPTLVVCAALTLTASLSAQAQHRYGNPDAPYGVPSGIGHWKARQDRADLRRYRGDPGAQAIMREKRHNLCRNVPEVC